MSFPTWKRAHQADVRRTIRKALREGVIVAFAPHNVRYLNAAQAQRNKELADAREATAEHQAFAEATS